MKQFLSISTLARIVAMYALLLPLSGCTTPFIKGLLSGGGEKPAQAEVPAVSPQKVEPAQSEAPPKINDTRLADPLDVPAAPESGFREEQARIRERSPVVTQGDISYENTTLTEDVTWRGTVLVRGWLVIASQATVRIEPGTVVRFMKSPILHQSPVLVVQGRIQCNGTKDRPVLFTSNYSEVARGDWDGILLLSSEKRNQFEHIRIEGAKTGLEAHFSTLLAKGVTITRSFTGMLLRDTTATLSAVDINECETGIKSHDSEVELRDSTLAANRWGIVARNSTVVLLSASLRDSKEQGLLADQCRIRFNSCDLSGNGGGARISGGEGQISATRFTRNRGVGLHLSGARIKIHQSQFADTNGDGIRMDDGRGVIWNCTFGGNSGYNLVNAGQEDICAVQNWWGNSQEDAISTKLFGAAQDARKGRITIAPWLQEKPGGLP